MSDWHSDKEFILGMLKEIKEEQKLTRSLLNDIKITLATQKITIGAIVGGVTLFISTGVSVLFHKLF